MVFSDIFVQIFSVNSVFNLSVPLPTITTCFSYFLRILLASTRSQFSLLSWSNFSSLACNTSAISASFYKEMAKNQTYSTNKIVRHPQRAIQCHITRCIDRLVTIKVPCKLAANNNLNSFSFFFSFFQRNKARHYMWMCTVSLKENSSEISSLLSLQKCFRKKTRHVSKVHKCPCHLDP